MYEQFERAFSTCSSSIDGNGFDRNVDVMKVLQIALGDNPNVIYFNKTQIRMSVSLFGGKQFHLSGAYSSSQNKTMQKDLQAALERAIEDIELLNPISDYDKLMCAYEYLQDHVVYDEQELEACCKHGKSRNPLSHNAYGALVKGLAVCDGIAAAFLFDRSAARLQCNDRRWTSNIQDDRFLRTCMESNSSWREILSLRSNMGCKS